MVWNSETSFFQKKRYYWEYLLVTLGKGIHASTVAQQTEMPQMTDTSSKLPTRFACIFSGHLPQCYYNVAQNYELVHWSVYCRILLRNQNIFAGNSLLCSSCWEEDASDTPEPNESPTCPDGPWKFPWCCSWCWWFISKGWEKGWPCWKTLLVAEANLPASGVAVLLVGWWWWWWGLLI